MPDLLLWTAAGVPWLPPLFLFGFGAIVGSFLNVCIYRIPKGVSIVYPGSHCACGKPIAWHDNVPILAWIFLRGRARCCGARFSIRYPAIEALTGLLFAACWLARTPGAAVAGMVFLSLLVVATFVDIDHMIIPDRCSIGGAVAGVALSLLLPDIHGTGAFGDLAAHLRSGRDALLGLLVGSAVVLWIGLLAEVVLRREAMGFGDVKLLGAIGAFCGWQGAVFSIFGGALIGTFVIAGIVVWRALTGRQPAPAPTNPEPAPANLQTNQPTPAEPAGEAPRPPESNSLLGRETPFGPMLAAAAAIHFLALHGPVADYFHALAFLLESP